MACSGWCGDWTGFGSMEDASKVEAVDHISLSLSCPVYCTSRCRSGVSSCEVGCEKRPTIGESIRFLCGVRREAPKDSPQLALPVCMQKQ